MDLQGDKRVLAIVGHFGSGKTEFSINYALKLADGGYKTALIDLDIANPYFRSREKQDMMNDNGIEVFSNLYNENITDEVPAITARIRMPLENTDYRVVADIGGNGDGAKIMIRFKKYFVKDDCEIVAVVNANRPDTHTIEGAMEQLDSIERYTGMKIQGLVNNTHMLRETTLNDVMKGYNLCMELCKIRNIPLKYNCCEEKLCEDLSNIAKLQEYPLHIFPMKLQMRDSSLDKNF